MCAHTYTDGEVDDRQEDDWEATGNEEMNELVERCKRNRTPTVTSVRDRLDHLHALVEVCCIALTHQDWKGQNYIQKQVAGVLCDFIGPEIKTANEELKQVWIKSR